MAIDASMHDEPVAVVTGPIVSVIRLPRPAGR